MDVDTTHWSGEGDFTRRLIDCLRQIDDVVFVRVEDAPATRSEADYNFISNELFVGFATSTRQEQIRRFGLLRFTRDIVQKNMTIAGLERALEAIDEIGVPDYADEGMLQYLRTERIVPPYQTRGYKIVELVRIYEIGTERRGG